MRRSASGLGLPWGPRGRAFRPDPAWPKFRMGLPFHKIHKHLISNSEVIFHKILKCEAKRPDVVAKNMSSPVGLSAILSVPGQAICLPPATLVPL